MNIQDQLINHIFFLIDNSGSMHGRENDVVKVFDGQIEYLARRSKEMDQETRVSVFTFNTKIECVVYDKDVLRLPSLAGIYRTTGQTALIDAVMQSISDLRQVPELYCNHSTLGFCITDGEENSSKRSASELSRAIAALPDNWTLAALVPDARGVKEAKTYGFPAQNVQVWSTENAKGVVELGETIRRVTDDYMQARKSGIRSVKNLFNIDLSKLNKASVKSALKELDGSQYMLLRVNKKEVIKDFVESWTKENFRQGCAYYELMKKEIIQANKQVCIMDQANGKLYSGPNARQMLGLPDYEVKVEPKDHANFTIYVQSNSTNRNLVPGTTLIVMK